MLFKVRGQWFTDEAFEWVKENKQILHNVDKSIVVFQNIARDVVLEDQKSLQKLLEEVPSFEMGKYVALRDGSYESWYAKEQDRINMLKEEHREKIEYIEQLKSRNSSGINVTLDKLTVDQYLRLVRGVVDCACDLTTKYTLDIKKTTVDTIEKEVNNLKQYGMMFATNKQIKPEDLVNLDGTYILKGALNVKYLFVLFNMFKIIENKISELKKLLSTTSYHIVEKHRGAKLTEFMFEKIKAENELIEFVVDVMMNCANMRMEPEHEILAKLANNVELDKNIGAVNAFRILYPEYFGDEQDLFDDFFKIHTELCLTYFMRTYLLHDNPKRLPFFKLYVHNGELHESLVTTFTEKYFLDKEKATYDMW